MTQSRSVFPYGVAAVLVVFASFFVFSSFVRADNPRVLFETSMGNIEIELYQNEAPATVENFIRYVKKGHYDGTIFHRIIPNFVVQGGGFDDKMKQKPTGIPVKNEAKNGLKNEKYTLSMARTRDPDSATSQFYINLKYNRDLDKAYAMDRAGYCVFGKVVSGEDVVDKMGVVKTTSRMGYQDVPVEPVILVKATLLEEKAGDAAKSSDEKPAEEPKKEDK